MQSETSQSGTSRTTKTPLARALCSALFAASLVAPTALHLQAAGPTESVLHNFSGKGDGGRPNGFAIADGAGALYGTTLWGGKFGKGVVYKLTPVSGGGYTERVLYAFTGGADGGDPASGLVMDAAGALYGTAQTTGGALAGVIFKLAPPTGGGTTWTFSTLYSFSGGADGGFPNCSLVFDAAGALYGTTTKGGDFGNGTVWKLTPPAGVGLFWTESVLYSFTGGADGALPYSPVLFDASGNIYGTAVKGGTTGAGTVWELVASATPGGPYTFQTLYTFTNSIDGAYPYAGLSYDSATPGLLYGTTFGGGAGYGVIFQLTPPAQAGGVWTESVLHTFSGTDGANLAAGLTYLGAARSFFGTTFAVAGQGVVFSLTQPASPGGTWTYNVVHRFTGTPDGSNPLATVTLDGAGNLFSTTYLGGTFGNGTVFEISKGSTAH